jgi:pimeloyl-ACP methyl ester carboxylesterase
MNEDSRRDQVLRLRDGRDLGYAEWGDPAGRPLMLFHGLPGSRLFAGLVHEQAVAAGVRLIAPDRPGFGLSTRDPHRRITDWPDDVVELADHLGLERFPVSGISGGGPYAAACAWKMPDRLTRVGLISAVGPFEAPGATEGMLPMNKLLFGPAERVPALGRTLMALMGLARYLPEGAMKRVIPPGPDQEIVSRPEVLHGFHLDLEEAFRQGGWGGPADDMLLAARPWRFPLEEIRVPVHLWQGEEDRNVTPNMGRYLAEKIPNCQAEFIPGAAHLWAIDNFERIARTLLA